MPQHESATARRSAPSLRGFFRYERGDGAGGGEHATDAVADRDLGTGDLGRGRPAHPMLGPGDKRLPQPHQLLMISALASNG